MTKPFRQLIQCQHCGENTPASDPLNLWIRKHPLLGSAPREAALVVDDLDFVFHRYMTPEDKLGTRDMQYVMFVEAKTNGATIDPSQEDTLSIIHQLLCTRPFKFQRDGGKFVEKHPQNSRVVRSKISGRMVQIQCFGLHRLFLTGNTPDDGRIQWDGFCNISPDQLAAILRFDLDPDTLKPMEHRRRKKARKPEPALF